MCIGKTRRKGDGAGVICYGAIEVSQKFPGNASAGIAHRKARIDCERPIEVIDRSAMVTHPLQSNSTVMISGGIIRAGLDDFIQNSMRLD